jgi:hypothetical protein
MLTVSGHHGIALLLAKWRTTGTTTPAIANALT